MDFSTIVGVASHDMKNSVGVITAYLEDLLAQHAETSMGVDAGTLLQQALYEAQRVNGQLVQLMGVYKLEHGMYPFDPQEVHLAEFAGEALARVRPLTQVKGLGLECEVDAQPESWFFDREMVASVVTQAMFNAVRYTRSKIALRLSAGPDGLQIAVDDDGLGFPGFMLDQAYPIQGINAQTGSTGLGLYFARQVALLHRRGAAQGHTRLENLGGGGGRFSITLP